MQEELLSERLGKIETRLEEHSRLLQEQKEKNETLLEMKTLLSIQIEDSKKRDKQLESFEFTLIKVNENLTNLNHNQQQLSNRVSDIEGVLNDQKTARTSLIKTILSYILTSGGSILVAWLLYKLGVK